MDYTSFSFKPIFKPIKNTKPTAPAKLDDYNLIIEWILDESIDNTEPRDFGEYMSDTYNLILFYSGDACVNLQDDTIELQRLTDYCSKYGSPFGNGLKNEIKLGDLMYVAFEHLRLILDTFAFDGSESARIDQLCIALTNAIKHEQGKGKPGDYKFVALRAFSDDGEQLLDLSRENSYIYKTHIVYDCSDNDYYKNLSFPLALIRCNTSDIPILTRGTYKDKIKLIKDRLLENLSELLNINPPQFKMIIENGLPVIEASTDNHLICFLFTYLTKTSFNICPHCKTLLTNGKKYCSKKHMDAALQATPEKKLMNMLNKWLNRYKGTDKELSYEQYEEIIKIGIKKLEYYPYETVKNQLQDIRKSFLKEGE